jgi:DGQHR domain-containing protein
LVDEHLRDDRGRQVGNADLVFEYENHFFVIEVSLQREQRNEKILAWFQWFNPTLVEIVRRTCEIQRNKRPFRVYVDLTRSSDGEGADSLPNEVRDSELSNAVIFKDDIEYFEDVYTKVRLFARYDLLSFLGVHPEESSIPIRGATQFYMGNVYALSFVLSAEILLKSAYVFRRRGRGVGYQRFLNFQRIREIEDKVRDGRILSFPNSILINIERELTVEPRRSPEQCPSSCRFEFPTEYCSSRIVDGQHRLMGISRLPEETRRQIYLQVIAFSQLSQALEIRTFVEINNNQRRVDRNLVLNLVADFTWPDGTKESFQRSAVLLARQLHTYRLASIFFGAADESREGKIYLTTFVSSLLSNNLIGGRYHIWRGREFENMSEVLSRIRNPTKISESCSS